MATRTRALRLRDSSPSLPFRPEDYALLSDRRLPRLGLVILVEHDEPGLDVAVAAAIDSPSIGVVVEEVDLQRVSRTRGDIDAVAVGFYLVLIQIGHQRAVGFLE